MEDLKVGVVGAGVFGGYHAAKYAAHPNARLIGVHDPDPARAAALAERTGCDVFATPEALAEVVDAVSVASPARTHAQAARTFLGAGAHVLVEKPLAVTPVDAEALVAAADAAGRVLAVGHQERFVFAAMGLLDISTPPRRIAARRRNPYSPRGGDVSVTLDLMVHDLDLARRLAGGAEAVSVTAEGRSERTDHLDRADAEIAFANGVTASLSASRLNPAPDRVMRAEFPDGVVEVDFVAKTFSNTTDLDLDPDFASRPEARDSLGANVNAFIDAILSGGVPPITGADGLAAVRLAAQVDRAAAPVAAG